MGMDPISIAMLAQSGFSAYQNYRAGDEAKQAYDEQAAEIGRQTAYGQRMALEEMKDLNDEGRARRGQIAAAAGKSGLRVAGSAATLSQAIAAKVERRKALVGFQANEMARQGAFQADQYHSAGRAAKKASRIEAVGSLLTGGLKLARRKEKTGYWFFKPKDDDLSHLGGYRPSTGYGTNR